MTRARTAAFLWLVLPAALAAPAFPEPAKDRHQAAEAVPDTELGLWKASVFEVLPPPAVAENASEPGERSLPARPTTQWPPVIPHSIRDFLPITRGDNWCIDCHGIESKEEGEPTPIPRSHYVDLRRDPGSVGDAPYGARWLCITCHLAQTDAPALVDNSAHSAKADEPAPAGAGVRDASP